MAYSIPMGTVTPYGDNSAYYLLDGNDWEADCFITDRQFTDWTCRMRTIYRMHQYSAAALDFMKPGTPAPGAMRAQIPGCDLGILFANGRIPDPYFGRNLEAFRWSETYSWGFRKTFRLPEALKKRRQIRLFLKGIDYAADIFVNGTPIVGRHVGMFLPFEYDITSLVDRDGENLLALVFAPAPQACPNHQESLPAEFAQYHRHQCGFGWDWLRQEVTTGIWDSVILSGTDTARISDRCFRYLGDGHCRLELTVEALETCSRTLEVRLTPDGFAAPEAAFKRELALEYGKPNKFTFDFDLADPHLWFPNLYGEQPLYDLTLTLDGITETRRVGLRTIRMIRNPGSPEGAYDETFEINGRAIFARGLNWVPIDLDFYKADTHTYEPLVRRAAMAGFNLFRAWGGGLIEKEAFYDCCDRYGIMVWQEFPHGCSNSPKDVDYLAYSRREGDAALRKIRNHVSLSLVCGGNEVLYYGEIPDSPMFEAYRELCAELVPDLAFHVSCPDVSRPGERNHGPWSIRPHAEWNQHDRLLASEVGCGAMPCPASVAKFIPENELEPPFGQSAHYHFLQLRGEHDIHRQWAFFAPETLAEHCMASMFAQADMTGYQMEHYRQGWPHQSGCFFWQYNEPWPTFAWSLVDYYGVPKTAMSRLAKSNAPRMLSLRDEAWCCPAGKWRAELFLCNDPAPFAGTAELELWSAAGEKLASWREERDFASGVTRIGGYSADVPAGIMVAVLHLTDKAGSELFRTERLYGVPDFKTAFHQPHASVEVAAKPGEVTLRNTGKNVALMVHADLAGIDPANVYWLDNDVTLTPGETRVLRYEAEKDAEVTLSGWNL